mgnify:CR=1 FL=1
MKADLTKNNLQAAAYWTIILTGAVAALIYFRPFLEPIVLALLVWYLIRTIRKFIGKIKVLERFCPLWLQRILAFGIAFGVLYGIYQIISLNVALIAENANRYDLNLRLFLVEVRDFTDTYSWLPNIEDTIRDFDYKGLITGTFNSISAIVGSIALILVYVVFFVIEENYMGDKMHHMFKKDSNRQSFRVTVERISQSVNKYFTVKTEVSILTAVVSFLLLLLMNVDFPVLWAFIIFVLNFIPYVGSLVASLLPAIFAIFQFASFWPFVYVLLVIEAVQIIVGNYIEPKLMGRTLNLSPLAVIMALSFWGSLWGILGMILAVPIVSVIIIICTQFPATRGIAVLLTENGDIGQLEQE